MQIRVLVNGAYGHMGQEAVKAINAAKDLTLVGQAGRGDNLSALIQTSQAEVVVDLTTADSAYANAKAIIDANVHPVIGTTGFLPGQIEQLQALSAAKHLGGVIAPNFSVGAILLMKLAVKAAAYFDEVEIIEAHHPAKLDAPSGTARKTAELIAKARIRQPASRQEKELLPGARGAKHEGIPIHAVRLSGILAEQEVMFGGQGESLSIKHKTLTRETFMPGILLACRKVVELDKLLYGLENLI
jgi:4-hydroxy-tetrahydrodipicolinate reductase